MNNNKPILLVESNDEDANVIELALNQIHVTNRLERMVNNEDTLTYLKEDHHTKPCMILLGINSLPNKAHELFTTIKADMTLKDIPVVILRSSKTNENISEHLESGIVGCIQKPFDYKKFIEVMRKLGMHWILREKEDSPEKIKKPL